MLHSAQGEINLSIKPKPIINILLVGTPLIEEKRKLAIKMLDLAKDYKLEIRETENLPLPEVENRSRIDYIIFMIDLTNNFSYQRYQKIIHNIHPDYILTKCILVAFGIENKQYQVNIDDLENYTNSLNYDINCLFTTKKVL